jgi:intein-encoded DNA endonuclease-like protein
MKKVRWTKTEIDQLKIDYLSFADKDILEKKYKRNFHNIQIKANALGFQRGKPTNKNKPYIFLNDKEIINFYVSGNNCREISEKCNFSESFINTVLKRNNIALRSLEEIKTVYQQDDSFFDIINTEEKAYFLGFLYADGCCYKDRHIKLSIKSKDRHILEDFLKSIKSDRPIYTNKRNMATILFTSKKLHKSLNALGCPNRKTFKIKFPTEEQVPKHLIHHFIRGYFDGDGGVCFSAKTFRFYFCGTQAFLEGVSDILNTEIGFNKNKLFERWPERKTNIRSLCHGGNKKAFIFREYLYKDATIFLKRKYNKFFKI